MKTSENPRLVFVSCANHTQGKLIARSLVEKRLAACVNILRSPSSPIIVGRAKWKRPANSFS
jgi:uncharacterized protein involved in tolerance to divalent cations